MIFCIIFSFVIINTLGDVDIIDNNYISDGDITITGDCTANSFFGDGSYLTGISGNSVLDVTNITNSNGNQWFPTTNNIQLAINDLNSSNGGLVSLPSYTFNVTVPIKTYNRTIIIEGKGLGEGGIPITNSVTIFYCRIISKNKCWALHLFFF